MRRPRVLVALAVACLLVLPAVSRAGQVRINVTNNLFSPSDVTVNVGDQVVWVWVLGGHSVTSGVSGKPGTGSIFQSNVVAVTSTNPAFSWMADRISSVPYFCVPHASMGMTGTLDVVAGGAPVSSFRITEVQFAEGNGRDLIEITNMGDASGDLGRYRLSAAAGAWAAVPLVSHPMAPGQTVVIHCNETGTNNANNLYMPTLGDLPLTGSVSLYVAHMTAAGASLTDPRQMVDFVQWGAAGRANESTANTAGYWTSGTFVSGGDNVASTISFCGSALERGVTTWSPSPPTMNAPNACATPSLRTSWGRIKQVYR